MAVDYDPVVEQKDRSGRVVKNAIGRIAERIDRSVVIDSKTGDTIIKLVSLLPKDAKVSIDLDRSFPQATQTVIKSGYDVTSGLRSPDGIKEWESMDTSSIKADGSLTITLPAYSMVVIRMGK
jgi:alpha-L-arabinofuranosidase